MIPITRSINKFKLQYISDIHLEHRVKIPRIIPETNYLALLGDIGHPTKQLYSEFLENCSKNWDKVFLVSGNHEYLQQKYSMEEIDKIILDITAKYPNICYLNNKKSFIDHNLILGTTLWSDNTILRPEHNINKLHIESVNWLHSTIDKNQDKNIIVLSHYLPSYKLIIPKYFDYKPSFQYASNLDYLLKNPIKAWLCGHSHCQLEKYINGVYCGINTLGPDQDNLDKITRILEL